MPPSQISLDLAECIEQSLAAETQDFQWDAFFRLWFRGRGTSVFFLFKRHLGVTNTQYVELFSLLQANCVRALDPKSGTELLFHTTEQMRSTASEAVNALLEAPNNNRKVQIAEFAERYYEVFASTIAVDMFYCSCAVYLPPGLTLDVKQVCADAGYVHSAGSVVYIRNIKKARRKDFDANLRQYLDSLSEADLPIPFVVYAHEDFSEYDRQAKDLIGRGIEHTKLYLEKMNMGGYRLSQIVQEMRAEYEGRLDIPEPGRYDEMHNFRGQRTLWLLCDRSISQSNVTASGSERYYICYEQTVKNSNPMFFFDENKPAWKSHTTLPQTLTAALMNATRPHSREARICDPFCGTGTTWFEGKRLQIDASLQCSDQSPACPLMVTDNLTFFLASSATLERWVTQLKDIGKTVGGENPITSPEATQADLDFGEATENLSWFAHYRDAVELLGELRKGQPHEDQEFILPPEFVDRLGRLTLLTRFIFYVALRAELRYQGGYKRRSVTFEKAFANSLSELVSQTEQLIEVRRGVEGHVATSNQNYVVFQDKYSPSVAPAFLLRSINELSTMISAEVSVSDARSLEPSSLDVILCDPPYGFNTSEDQAELTKLYSEFLDAAVRAIRDRGHLIICLPAESYTGRELPYCTRSGLIVSQVLAKVATCGKYAYLPARSVPSQFFAPPYYWEAERALRRVILHFRIARK
jgi:hypothetical protein